jgi:hypothetical protein
MPRKKMCQSAVRVSILALCLTFAGDALAQSTLHSVTLTGWVSCTTCVLPNTCRAQTRRSCVAWWVRQGAAYVLVVGTRNYRLVGADKELASFAGRTVTVTGDPFRSEVTVATVQEAPSTK